MSSKAETTASPPHSSQSRRFGGTLGRTLTVWFVLLALAPMIVVAWISYRQAEQTLTRSAVQTLQGAAQANIAFIQNWFDYRLMDIRSQAGDSHVIALAEHLNDALRSHGRSSTLTDKDGMTIEELIALRQTYDYLQDIYLIDASGKVLFSARGLLVPGSSLFDGQLAHSRFAALVRRVLQERAVLFSDIERYHLSAGQLTGFLGAPLRNIQGEPVGVLVMQLHLKRVYERMASVSDPQSGRFHYLVGDDGLLRSPMGTGITGVLEQTVATEQFRLWMREHGPDGLISSPQKEVAFEYLGPTGHTVIGLHHLVGLPGVNWALISRTFPPRKRDCVRHVVMVIFTRNWNTSYVFLAALKLKVEPG